MQAVNKNKNGIDPLKMIKGFAWRKQADGAIVLTNEKFEIVVRRIPAIKH